VPQICIDDYLWSLYERTPKIDTNKVLERIKVTVKKKRKIRTVIKTITKYVVGDFTWKDPIAAQRTGMSLKDYVIGGMDPGFKLKLHRALRAMEDAGHMPGITSAFRDNYRQWQAGNEVLKRGAAIALVAIGVVEIEKDAAARLCAHLRDELRVAHFLDRRA